MTYPSHNVSASNPDTSVPWANYAGMAADPFFNVHNRAPYIENYMLSIQRQLTANALHHILAVVPANLGNPALCQSLSGCGPFGEDSNYTNASGGTVYGTRNLPGDQNTYGAPITSHDNYGENTSQSTIANSNYNALESTLRYQRNGSQLLLSYTYAKSIDQGSNLGEQLNPLNPRQLARGFATGFPVTLTDNSDNSLLGTLGNGVNNYLLDTPQQLPGSLKINTNGRNGKPAFDTALFPIENYGTLGNAKRRAFYGPGIENFDLTIQKDVRLADAKSLTFRMEAFNAFNQTQFYGPAAVDGQVDDTQNFGKIVSAASPRLVQLVVKFAF